MGSRVRVRLVLVIPKPSPIMGMAGVVELELPLI
jgi:hypothetical protein